MNVSVIDVLNGTYSINKANPAQTPSVASLSLTSWNAGGSGAQAGSGKDHKSNTSGYHE